MLTSARTTTDALAAGRESSDGPGKEAEPTSVEVATGGARTAVDIDPPTPGHPYWRKDGRRASLCEVIASVNITEFECVRAMHAQGVSDVLVASFAAADAGDPMLGRALAFAASRLCQETVGLWSAGTEAA